MSTSTGGASPPRLRRKPGITLTPSGSSSDDEASPSSTKTTKTTKQAGVEGGAGRKGRGFGILDVLRMLGGVILLSSAMSYFVMDGESLLWGMRPAWARWEVVRTLWTPPLTLTDAQLALYDGTNPSLPIYVALNGSIFDVSASPHTYGPSGGYHVFAGVDAARGFVTGCFAEDRTWDLRGVEEMYLPHDEELDLYDAGKLPNYEKMSKERKEELRVKSEERRAKAMQRVRGTIRHWDGFFRNHEKYFWVGKVVGREGVLERTPVRKLCKQAQRKRPPKVVGGEAA